MARGADQTDTGTGERDRMPSPPMPPMPTIDGCRWAGDCRVASFTTVDAGFTYFGYPEADRWV